MTIAAGGTELLGPFHFQAPQTGIGDGHKCVLAAIIAEGEPQVPNKFDAPNFNQVGQRNIQFSDCAAPRTNATGINGTVQLTLTVTPSDVVPALTGSTDIEISVPDPGGVWAGVWGGQPDSGTAFTVQTSADTTTLRMGANQVVLNGVSLAAGESRSAKMAVTVPSGSANTTLALQAPFRTLQEASS